MESFYGVVVFGFMRSSMKIATTLHVVGHQTASKVDKLQRNIKIRGPLSSGGGTRRIRVRAGAEQEKEKEDRRTINAAWRGVLPGISQGNMRAKHWNKLGTKSPCGLWKVLRTNLIKILGLVVG